MSSLNMHRVSNYLVREKLHVVAGGFGLRPTRLSGPGGDVFKPQGLEEILGALEENRP